MADLREKSARSTYGAAQANVRTGAKGDYGTGARQMPGGAPAYPVPPEIKKDRPELQEAEKKGEDLGFGFNEEGYPLQDKYEFQGLPVAVENKEGSTRKWYDPDGKEKGSTEMRHDYGYIEGATGSDGEPVDVYIGPDEDAEFAYVVHQNKAPDFEEYDEDKVMLGFKSEEDAREAYLKQYDDERFYGGMSSMPVDKFKEKVLNVGGEKITNEGLDLPKSADTMVQHTGRKPEDVIGDELGEAAGEADPGGDGPMGRHDPYDFASGLTPPKSIKHLEDLKDEQYVFFLEGLIEGRVLIMEKLDGSCRIEFGRDERGIWTQTKYGSRTWNPKGHDFLPMQLAHRALRSRTLDFPLGESYTAEVLTTEVPNVVPYDGQSRIVVHGGEVQYLTNMNLFVEGQGYWKLVTRPPVAPRDSLVDYALVALAQLGLPVSRDTMVESLKEFKSAFGGGLVEGLVFYDPKTDAWAKLVDRQLFTQLNRFMWSYRDALERGRLVGEVWKPGVMSELREGLAQAIGVSGIRSPQIVNRILRETGERQNVRETLSAWIEYVTIMPAGFQALASAALTEAISRFVALREEWNSKKKSELAIELRGQKFVMHPLIKARTDLLFKETAARLRLMKLELEALREVDDHLSRRERILELALGEYRMKQLREDHVIDTTVQQIAESFSGKGSDAKDVELFIRDHEALLKKHGLAPVQELGAGTNGVAFEILGNKVLKVTIDPEEATASNHLLGKKLKHVVHIDKVFRFPEEKELSSSGISSHVYGIVQERLRPLSESEKDGIKKLTNYGLKFLGYGWETEIKSLADVRSRIHKVIQENPQWVEQGQELLESFEKYQITDIILELREHGISWADLHAGNVMKRGADYVAIDLGASSSPGKEPDVLERAIHEQISVLMEAAVDAVGVTLGRFQPFHKGHAEMVRKLTTQFSKVLVLMAGNKGDSDNPFSYEIRVEMMEKSLPDVWSKIEVHPAKFDGKPSGYVPGIISDIVKAGSSVIKGDTAINVLVGGDRYESIKKQVDHARKMKKEKGAEILFDPDAAIVKKLADVRSDDDAERISGQKLRAVIQKGDVETFKKMVDPHLISDLPDMEEVWGKLRKEIGAPAGGPLREEETPGKPEGSDEPVSAAPSNKLVLHSLEPTQFRQDRNKAMGMKKENAAALQAIIDANSTSLLKRKPHPVDAKRLSPLGQGLGGVAYDMGENLVFKITNDMEEAKASNGIKGKRFPHLIQISDVFRFKNVGGVSVQDGSVFGIVEEKLQPLTSQEEKQFGAAAKVWLRDGVVDTFATWDPQRIMGAIHRELEIQIDKSYGLGADVDPDMDWSEVGPNKSQTTAVDKPAQTPQDAAAARDVSQAKKRAAAKKELSKQYATMKGVMEKFQFPGILKDLKDAGIKFFDFHEGNIMKRGSDYVVVDLGRSQSGGAEPPFLEKIVREIGDLLISEEGASTGGAMWGTPGSAQAGTKAGSSGWSSPSGIETDENEDDDRVIWQDKIAMGDAMQKVTHGRPDVVKGDGSRD